MRSFAVLRMTRTSTPAALKKGEMMDRVIAITSAIGILVHLVLRFAVDVPALVANIPLFVVLVVGGLPLIWELLQKMWKRNFGADLLAGISIVSAIFLQEYLVASIVILMLSGGETLEEMATRRASSVLAALASRMPHIAHRRVGGKVEDIALDHIQIGNELTIFPHEVCPVDGIVVEGHGIMDESYLTGEPFEMSKTPGAQVLSGAINGESALVIRADRLPVDSRYAKIMQVMQETEQSRPQLRRLGDQLGAWFTPVAVIVGGLAWWWGGSAERFLAVVVIATPCPLLIAIPVAIIGAISLAARRGIIIKIPAILEQVAVCRTLILDKTGTLTFGRPQLTDVICASGVERARVLGVAASAEQYSKHPLAVAIRDAAQNEKLPIDAVERVSEVPGHGMQALVDGVEIQILGRSQVHDMELPPVAGGLECVLLMHGKFAALFRFRDAPRAESKPFIGHLSPKHRMDKIMLVSGDRESEVRYLAETVGIQEVYASQSPEEKVAIVLRETALAKTIFVGDGINDAPALMAATVGIAFGSASDITSEAAGAVILEPSLQKVDEIFHIGIRMRRIALQSALGGMALSVVGMGFAAMGWLPPIAGAVGQEILDLIAVLNAVRVAFPPKTLTDFD